MTTLEWEDSYKICEVIQSYANSLSEVVFSPSVPGCGVVDSSYADITSGTELIEVKAVSRSFRGVDFRQVLTYAAMFHSAGTKISEVALMNPRLANVVQISLDDIAASAAGCKSTELMHELVECMIGLQVSA